MNKQVLTMELKTPWGKSLKCFWRKGTCDCGVLTSCLAQDEYHLEKLGLKNGMVAIDLGAHIGGATLALSGLGLQTFSIEALPENCQLLEQNLVNNNLKATIINAAISSKDSQATKIFYSGQNEDAVNGAFFIGGFVEKPNFPFCVVLSLSLVGLFEQYKIQHCDYIKTDIEGSEWDVFSDVPLELLQKVDIIAGELHPLNNKKVYHGDLLPYLKNQFVDVSEKIVPEFMNLSLPHFVYYNKNKGF